jgi:hypothetical protein
MSIEDLENENFQLEYCIESFNGKMRHELLIRELFFTLEEAKTLIARWREE